MGITKLYNKNTLREHPDLSPVADPSFNKGHSFIFPADELVMCTVIDAPTDIGGSMSGRILQSVKMSIIAKKPNIFTSEFTREFQSVRSFELDSVIIPINSSNAPVVPWGSDGYAPNLNFTQDRNWRLPSGDFKRQIKAFTTHTPSTSSWKYNFWFPIIFNEQYWQALNAADNDFYNFTEPQNGKNQKWLRYHNPSAPPFGWLITYRFELNYTSPALFSFPIAFRSHTIISELNLSNEQTGIQDYNSNPDYAATSIKTCIVGGTPSSSGFIFGYRNTSCFGYFTKQTAWDAGEKDKLTAVFRIRPFEAGDRLGSRGSSKFPITTDVVWAPVSEPIENDPGLDFETDGGFIIVTDNDGSAILISFDPGDDKIITVKGEIDYTKLNTIFPGVTKFSIYCRLYNGTTLLGISKTTLGTFNITGDQFVESGEVKSYAVAGIPAGYTMYSIVLPSGWSVNATHGKIGTTQIFDFNVGIGSGTIIITYEGPTEGITFQVYIDVYSGACRMGEEITSVGILIPSDPLPVNPTPVCGDEDTCPHPNTDCPFTIDVFADANNPGDDLRNDKTDFYGLQYMGSPGISAITLILQKNDSNCGGCNWTDIYTFVEPATPDVVSKVASPYGLFFAFGHSPNFTTQSFIDENGNKYTGLLLYWIRILQAFGAGQYRMKIVYTSAIDNSTATDYDVRIFCLHQWNCHNIDGTVRIETTNSGFRGTMNNNKMQIDYGSGWYGQTRLRGIFYETKPSYNKEFNQYNDQEFNAFKPIIHELVPKFLMDIKPAPGWVDWILSNYIMLSDQILVTDYNASNRKKFFQFPVINESGIDTKDDDFVNALAWSQLSFSFGQNSLRRRNN